MGRITNALKLLAVAHDAVESPAAADDGPTTVATDLAEAPSNSATAGDAPWAGDEARGASTVSFHGPEFHAPAVRPVSDDLNDRAAGGRDVIGAGGGPAGYESPSELGSEGPNDWEPGLPLAGHASFAAGDRRGDQHPEEPIKSTAHDLSPFLFDSLDFSLEATRGLIAELQGDAAPWESWPTTLGSVEFSTFVSACSAAIDEGVVAPRIESSQITALPDGDLDGAEPVIRTMIELEEELDLSFVEPTIEHPSGRSWETEPAREQVAVEPLEPLRPTDDFAVDSEPLVAPDADGATDVASEERLDVDLIGNSKVIPVASLDESWLPTTTAASDVVWRQADELNWDLPTNYGSAAPLQATHEESLSDGHSLDLETVGATEYERQLASRRPDDPAVGAALALAQSIRQTRPAHDSHMVLVLSPGPSSDVADTIAQLALLLAREEFARVLLVDANLATSTLTERFEAQREGLLEAVLDGEPWDELVRATATAGLHLMASGDIVTARGIQIQSEEIVRLRRLVSRWRMAYDYVLIDGGSVELPLTRDLVQQADSTFLQVSLGHTDEQQAAAAMQQLQLLGGQVRGCLVLDG